MLPAVAETGYWIPLDQCTEPSAVTRFVAAAIGCPSTPQTSPDTAIVSQLRGSEALLVLDNCEHLVAPIARLLDRLLDRCRDLRVLATSRAPLGVRGEEVYVLEPLRAPSPEDLASPSRLTKIPSVEMYLDRRRAAGVRALPSPDELRVIGQICARLDGLPLAIELAAAQSSVFSTDEIAARLEARIPLARNMALPERQQTIQRTIEWSCSLLSEDELQLFALCGVFADSWTLPALEAVAQDPQVVKRFMRLVASSLVSVVDEGERRYRLLVPVREYALELGASATWMQEARRRHARYYLEIARKLAEQAALRPGLAEFAVIEADYHNYVAALDWALESRDGDTALGLAQALWVYWRVNGRVQMGRDYFEATLRLDITPKADIAVCHAALANFLQLLGARDAAIEHAEKAIEIFREADHLIGMTMALGMLGELCSEQGDFERARNCYQRALALQEHGPRWARGILLADWGIAEYRAGNLDFASGLLEDAWDALGIDREMWYAGLVRIRQGSIARSRGAFTEARALIREGLRHVHRLGGAQEVAHGLEELAATECQAGETTRAVSLLAAAARLREEAKTPIAPSDLAPVDETVAAARTLLTERDFSRAWVYGRGLTRAQAVAFASGDEVPDLEGAIGLAELTPREREVAQLVAEGLTNREIAERLGISEATARTHVERVRNKLGVRTRVGVARLVAHRG